MHAEAMESILQPALPTPIGADAFTPETQAKVAHCLCKIQSSKQADRMRWYVHIRDDDEYVGHAEFAVSPLVPEIHASIYSTRRAAQ